MAKKLFTFISGDTVTFEATDLEEARKLYKVHCGYFIEETGISDEQYEDATVNTDVATLVQIEDGGWEHI